jgi:calcineurin-like phosphoesterase family protein
MNEEIIKRFNERVKPEDTVYFLGDFTFGRNEERKKFIERLNGNIIFVIGNHDKSGTCPIFTAIIKYGDGHFACICHDPIDHIHPYQYCIHGHSHNLHKTKVVNGVIYCNVGVDVRNFYPVSIEELHEEINQEKYKLK